MMVDWNMGKKTSVKVEFTALTIWFMQNKKDRALSSTICCHAIKYKEKET